MPFGQKRVQHLRRILKVGIHNADNAASTMLKSSADGDLMPEISRKLNDDDAAILTLQTFQDFRALVLASIVNEHEFVLDPQAVHRISEARMQGGKILGFVKDWNDDR